MSSESYCIPEQIRYEAIQKIEIEQKASKERYDKSCIKNVKYQVGDIVFMKSLPISTGESTKLQTRYKGPLFMTEILPSDTYREQDLGKKDSSKLDTTAHVSQLKIWRELNEEIESDIDTDE